MVFKDISATDDFHTFSISNWEQTFVNFKLQLSDLFNELLFFNEAPMSAGKAWLCCSFAE